MPFSFLSPTPWQPQDSCACCCLWITCLCSSSSPSPTIVQPPHFSPGLCSRASCSRFFTLAVYSLSSRQQNSQKWQIGLISSYFHSLPAVNFHAVCSPACCGFCLLLYWPLLLHSHGGRMGKYRLPHLELPKKFQVQGPPKTSEIKTLAFGGQCSIF